MLGSDFAEIGLEKLGAVQRDGLMGFGFWIPVASFILGAWNAYSANMVMLNRQVNKVCNNVAASLKN